MKKSIAVSICVVICLIVIGVLLQFCWHKNTTVDLNIPVTTISSSSTSTSTSNLTTTAITTSTTVKTTLTTMPTTSKKSTTIKTTSRTTGRRIVQRADPETGISWDGKSAIIYTYPDGSTGTVPKDGAKYEYLPGMYQVILFPRDSAGRLEGSLCNICNKKIGRKDYPNSCEHFNQSRYCPYCAVYVEANTCHSCSSKLDYKYCTHCGKIMGDGKNGTCARWLMGAVDCPNCGKHVEAYTCHTCD